AERDARLEQLFDDYNANGLTAIVDRNCSSDAIAQYARLRAADKLHVRMAISYGVSSKGKLADIQERIREVAQHPLCRPDAMLRIIGIKTFLDGGMLTGSAYMLKPWGVSKIYSIDDPHYRGMRYIEPDVLLGMVQTTVESGLQFTAHSVGDGAVQALLDAYEEVNRTRPIAATRPCITHSNFMTPESIAQAGRLKVSLDIQPAWLYLDARTLVAHFGYERLRWFQPLKTIFAQGVIAGGGSDHMQKIGALRAVNLYDPMLAMWVAVTRKSQGYPQPLHPEEALTREQAIRFYTINNAYIMFLDDQIGTLEAGKLADMIVVDRDLLTCPADDIRDAKVLRTYLGGKLVYQRK
ncbi:MAG TPA: amidohydrolase family protein, partial [Pirellulales bacterium]